MLPDFVLATADADRVNPSLAAAWAVTVAALLLSIGLRRRLALGVAEALFTAGLSGLLLLNYAALSDLPADPALLSASLVSLTVVWFIVAVWVERTPSDDDQLHQRRLVRHRLAVHAAAVTGLAGMGLAWSAPEALGGAGLLTRAVLLFCVTAGLYWWRRLTLARYAAVALALAATVQQTGPLLGAADVPVMTLAIGLGVGGLLVVIAANLADWRRRVFIWRHDPQRLTEPAPMHRRLYALVVVAGVLTGVLALARCHHPLTPLATVAAAFATLTVAHRWRSDLVGEIGLALAGQTVALIPSAWLPASPAAGLLGWALAGAYLLWLARFWHQQLDRGRPWTTAGRLIPSARNLSLAAVGGQAIWAILYASEQTVQADWQCCAAVVFMLLHWWLLTRDARDNDDYRVALAAALVLPATALPAAVGCAALGLRWPAAVWSAIVALALVVGVRRGAAQSGHQWVWNAYVGGWLPAALAYDATIGNTAALHPGAATLAVGGMTLALALHFCRRPMVAAAGA